MPNTRSKIKDYNENTLRPKPTEPQKLCNWLVKEDFPMNGLGLTSNILYQTTINCSNSKYKKKDTKVSVKRHSRNVIQTTKNHST